MARFRFNCWCYYQSGYPPGTEGGNILSNILLKILGAFFGGGSAILCTTGNLASTATHFNWFGITLAAISAVLAVFLWQVLIRTAV